MEGDEYGGELPQEEDLAMDTDTPAATAATGEPSEDPEKVRPRPPSLPPQPPRAQGRLSLSSEAEAWGPEAGGRGRNRPLPAPASPPPLPPRLPLPQLVPGPEGPEARRRPASVGRLHGTADARGCAAIRDAAGAGGHEAEAAGDRG